MATEQAIQSTTSSAQSPPTLTVSANASQHPSLKPSRLFSRIKFAIFNSTAPSVNRSSGSPATVAKHADPPSLVLRLLKGCVHPPKPSSSSVPCVKHSSSAKTAGERRTSIEGIAPKWLFSGNRDTPPSSISIHTIDPYADGPCGLGPLSPVPSTRFASDATDSTIVPMCNGLFGEESLSPLRVLSSAPSTETTDARTSGGHRPLLSVSGSDMSSGPESSRCAAQKEVPEAASAPEISAGCSCSCGLRAISPRMTEEKVAAPHPGQPQQGDKAVGPGGPLVTCSASSASTAGNAPSDDMASPGGSHSPAVSAPKPSAVPCPARIVKPASYVSVATEITMPDTPKASHFSDTEICSGIQTPSFLRSAPPSPHATSAQASPCAPYTPPAWPPPCPPSRTPSRPSLISPQPWPPVPSSNKSCPTFPEAAISHSLPEADFREQLVCRLQPPLSQASPPAVHTPSVPVSKSADTPEAGAAYSALGPGRDGENHLRTLTDSPPAFVPHLRLPLVPGYESNESVRRASSSAGLSMPSSNPPGAQKSCRGTWQQEKDGLEALHSGIIDRESVTSGYKGDSEITSSHCAGAEEASLLRSSYWAVVETQELEDSPGQSPKADCTKASGGGRLQAPKKPIHFASPPPKARPPDSGATRKIVLPTPRRHIFHPDSCAKPPSQPHTGLSGLVSLVAGAAPSGFLRQLASPQASGPSMQSSPPPVHIFPFSSDPSSGELYEKDDSPLAVTHSPNFELLQSCSLGPSRMRTRLTGIPTQPPYRRAIDSLSIQFDGDSGADGDFLGGPPGVLFSPSFDASATVCRSRNCRRSRLAAAIRRNTNTATSAPSTANQRTVDSVSIILGADGSTIESSMLHGLPQGLLPSRSVDRTAKRSMCAQQGERIAAVKAKGQHSNSHEVGKSTYNECTWGTTRDASEGSNSYRQDSVQGSADMDTRSAADVCC